MLKKLIDIIRNFYKTLTTKGKFIVIFPPILMGLSFFIFKKCIPTNNIPEYTSSINDSILNIMSLLVAFGLGVVTLLYSSSSPSIQRAKEYYPSGVIGVNNIPINYYQLIIIRIFYSLISQIFLVLFSFFIKIFLFNASSLWFILLEIVLLTHTILVELKVIISMYHLMWRD